MSRQVKVASCTASPRFSYCREPPGGMCAVPHLGVSAAASQFFREGSCAATPRLLPLSSASDYECYWPPLSQGTGGLTWKCRRIADTADPQYDFQIAQNHFKTGRNFHFEFQFLKPPAPFSPVLCFHSCVLHWQLHEGRYCACVTHFCILCASTFWHSLSSFEWMNLLEVYFSQV